MTTVRSAVSGHPLMGTSQLIWFAVRRDRVRILIWIVVLVAVTAATAASFPDLYPNHGGSAIAGQAHGQPSRPGDERSRLRRGRLHVRRDGG